MPAAVALSRRFYEQFGDELTNELVNLINGMHENTRSDLKETMDLNFARFDAKLEQRLGELRSEVRTEMAGLRAELIKWMFLFFTGSALTNILLR